MSNELARILTSFQIQGEFESAEQYGEGHINDTYLAVFRNGGKQDKYILQRISKRLTSDIPALMRNIELVTEFIKKRVLLRHGDPNREGLVLVRTKDDKNCYFDGDRYYRVYLFIDDATSHQLATPELFYESAVAFGNFANLLSDFDASQLTDTIKDFHNTPVRYQNFLNALEKDEFGRAKNIKREIEWVMSKKDLTRSITALLDSGAIPYRVTHNDTKLNNVMIDNKTGKGIAVIDLDTVMPGSLCYDFGDSIRFGCNPASEDEKDLSKVNFRMDLFEAYAKGYLSAIGNSITATEKESLAVGAIVMTLECGTRFLTDYLSGDVYFRTSRDGQNLDRARTQFKLVDDMLASFDQLKGIIARY